MAARKDRFIASSHYERWRKLRSLSWAIVAANVVRVAIAEGAALVDAVLTSENVPFAIVGAVAVFFMEVLFTSIFPFIGWYALCTFFVSRSKREARFTPVTDIEYFRDKLDGVSPTTVSLLADLRLERRNDMSASLLKLVLDGAISFEGDGLRIVDSTWRERVDKPGASAANAAAGSAGARAGTGSRAGTGIRRYSASEGFLLTTIENGGSFSSDKRIRKWEELAYEEFLNSGYVEARDGSDRKTGCGGCFGGCLVFLVLGGLLAVVMGTPWWTDFEVLADTLGSDAEIVRYMAVHPDFIVWVLALAVLIVLAMIALHSPVLGLIRAIIEAGSMDWRYQRTPAGEELTECIYGLKNYIHEFTGLSEADRKALVLWDDFFVYAVALDENAHVAREILGERGIDSAVFDILGL